MSYLAGGAYEHSGGEIDLYNFEDERFSSEDYVLTSPRSLEACRRLLIKPAELLYKPLAAFQGEVYDGASLRAVYDKYDYHERERQNKIRACRLERDNIITQELKIEGIDDSGHDDAIDTSASKREDTRTAWSLGRSPGSSVSRLTAKQSIGDTSSCRSPAVPTVTSDAVVRTPNELMQPETEGITYNSSSPHQSFQEGFAQSTPEASYHRSSPDLRQPAMSADYGEALSRSLSYMDLDSKRDRRRTLLGARRSLSLWASPDRQPTKITSAGLRRVLSPTKDMEVTKKDQKILEAMLARKQTDQDLEQRRSHAELHWDEERQQLRDDITMAELEKWRTLARKQREREQEQEEEQQRRLAEEAAWRRQCEQQVLVDDLIASQRLAKIKDSTDRKVEAKKLYDYERKLRQEEALDMLEQQQQLYRSKLITRSMQDLSKASSKREEQIAYENKIKKRQSRKRSATHRYRHSMIQCLNEHSKEDLRASITMKHLRGQRNHENALSSRDFRIELQRRESTRRRTKSQDRIDQMNQIMEAHNREMMKKSYFTELKANDTAQSNMEARSQAARRTRESRQSQQKSLHRRIKLQHDALQWEHASHAFVKEWKAKAVQQEKEAINYKVRSMAATAQKLREDLKKQYGGDTFDKKVREVEMQSRVGSGIKSAARNTSTVVLA